MFKPIVKTAAFGIIAILVLGASGALANTETERQCFAQTEACAVESANDGMWLFARNPPRRAFEACLEMCKVARRFCEDFNFMDNGSKCSVSYKNCMRGCRP